MKADAMKCDVCGMTVRPGRNGLRRDPVSGKMMCRDCAETVKGMAFVRNTTKRILTPKEIKAHLDRFVVGQDEAKRTLSTAVHEHLKRSIFGGTQKDNILMVGPSGSGKTFMLQKLAEIIDIPFTIVDATKFSETGFKGGDVEDIILRLYDAADQNKDKTEHGIVFIDEIDKIKERFVSSGTKTGAGVQNCLLKLIEGVDVNLNGSVIKLDDEYVVDTSGILFICGGAFSGLNEIVSARIGGKSMGFFTGYSDASGPDDTYLQATTEDFINFGMLPEFVGRFPVRMFLRPLGMEGYRKILTETDTIVGEYRRSFEIEDADLVFTPEALDAIADEAYGLGTGARGIRAVMEEVLADALFEVPSIPGRKKVIVDLPCVVDRKVPEIEQSMTDDEDSFTIRR